MTPKEKLNKMYLEYISTIKFTMEDMRFTYRDVEYELCIRKTARFVLYREIENSLNMLIELKESLPNNKLIDETIAFINEMKNELEKL